jgi:hypothetical protein
MFAGVAVRVAVQVNAVQQCLMLLERSNICVSQFRASLMDPRVGNAQVTGDVCHRLSTGLGELHRLALPLLRRGLVDFLHDPCPPVVLCEHILIYYYSMKLEQSHSPHQ